ncbi:MAG: hypothetical protein E6G06_10275 [Actinobacteria bacterium]|nr:MAG: hypothetical protein E6G06_10275 [Actinomycetota bacterium]
MKPRLALRLKRTVTIAGFLLLVAAPADAQTGYPPGPPTTQPSGTGSSEDLGTIAVGETKSSELCGFAPGATVRVTANGTFVLNATADANGCVQFEVMVISARSMEINGTRATAVCGPNAVVASGSATNATRVTQTLRFEIVCDPVARAGTATTGAAIARGALVGVALVGSGVLIVLGSRRRKTRDPG